MRSLTIGQVARLAGIGVETVRFYERKGILEEPPRTEAGYRQYPEDAVSRLRFVRRGKELGFTLKEIRELLLLRLHPDSSCADVKARAKVKIADIDARIDALRSMRRALSRLTRACSGNGTTDECPILEALDNQEKP